MYSWYLSVNRVAVTSGLFTNVVRTTSNNGFNLLCFKKYTFCDEEFT